MQGPYMELVNKLVFKKVIELKTICDVDKKIEKIVSKKFYYKNFVTDYNKILKDNMSVSSTNQIIFYIR